jgi:hypothetical protein
MVAVGGAEVLDEALQVEHYPGGDLLRANPRQGQVPGAGGPTPKPCQRPQNTPGAAA